MALSDRELLAPYTDMGACVLAHFIKRYKQPLNKRGKPGNVSGSTRRSPYQCNLCGKIKRGYRIQRIEWIDKRTIKWIEKLVVANCPSCNVVDIALTELEN